MPASRTKIGAQKCVIHRVMNSAGSATSRGFIALRAEEIAGVIERHDHQNEAAQQIDGIEARPRAAGDCRIDEAGTTGGVTATAAHRRRSGSWHPLAFAVPSPRRPRPTTIQSGPVGRGRPRKVQPRNEVTPCAATSGSYEGTGPQAASQGCDGDHKIARSDRGAMMPAIRTGSPVDDHLQGYDCRRRRRGAEAQAGARRSK